MTTNFNSKELFLEHGQAALRAYSKARSAKSWVRIYLINDNAALIPGSDVEVVLAISLTVAEVTTVACRFRAPAVEPCAYAVQGTPRVLYNIIGLQYVACRRHSIAGLNMSSVCVIQLAIYYVSVRFQRDA